MVLTRPEVSLTLARVLPKRPTRGVCSRCGCTEDDPCIERDPDSDGDVQPCSWVDNQKTLCSSCIRPGETVPTAKVAIEMEFKERAKEK